jgi:hypothetical protein
LDDAAGNATITLTTMQSRVSRRFLGYALRRASASIIGGLSVFIVVVLIVGGVVLDLDSPSSRGWFDRHQYTTGIATSVLLIAATALLLEGRAERQRKREWEIAGGVQLRQISKNLVDLREAVNIFMKHDATGAIGEDQRQPAATPADALAELRRSLDTFMPIAVSNNALVHAFNRAHAFRLSAEALMSHLDPFLDAKGLPRAVRSYDETWIAVTRAFGDNIYLDMVARTITSSVDNIETHPYSR